MGCAVNGRRSFLTRSQCLLCLCLLWPLTSWQRHWARESTWSTASFDFPENWTWSRDKTWRFLNSFLARDTSRWVNFWFQFHLSEPQIITSNVRFQAWQSCEEKRIIQWSGSLHSSDLSSPVPLLSQLNPSMLAKQLTLCASTLNVGATNSSALAWYTPDGAA